MSSGPSDGRKRKCAKPSPVLAPILITTINCVAGAGIDERRLRELLLRHPDVRRVVPGTKIVGILPCDLLALLESDEEVSAPLHLGDEPQTVDSVLAAIGRRAAGGAR